MSVKTFAASAAASLALGAVLLLSAPASGPAMATDACAGQVFPNWSDACIKQKVADICKGGGGGEGCGESSKGTSAFVGEVKVKQPSSQPRVPQRR